MILICQPVCDRSRSRKYLSNASKFSDSNLIFCSMFPTENGVLVNSHFVYSDLHNNYYLLRTMEENILKKITFDTQYFTKYNGISIICLDF